MMRIDVATLFPEMCQRVLDESILGRAARKGPDRDPLPPDPGLHAEPAAPGGRLPLRRRLRHGDVCPAHL